MTASEEVAGPMPREAGSRSRERTDDPGIARAEKLAAWLDDAYLDPIIGFVFPGGGDLATGGIGVYAVLTAVRLGLPRVVIARMLLNLALDTAVGAIPILGDLFDAFFKAHKRNARLLRQRHEGREARPVDWLIIIGAVLLFLAALALPVLVLVALVVAIF